MKYDKRINFKDIESKLNHIEECDEISSKMNNWNLGELIICQILVFLICVITSFIVVTAFLLPFRMLQFIFGGG